MKRDRKWIFRWLFIGGVLLTAIFLVFQSNVWFKNSDFTKKVVFDSEDGMSGSLVLKRNDLTPSVLDWATFENGDQVVFFSSSRVEKKILVDLPELVESGKYYLDVEAVFLNGEKQTKTISFRVI